MIHIYMYFYIYIYISGTSCNKSNIPETINVVKHKIAYK